MTIGIFHSLMSGIKNRPQFFLAFLTAAVLSILLFWLTSWSWSTNLLIGWNTAIWLFLANLAYRMWQADHSDMQEQAKRQDESKWIILLLVIMALIMCMVAIGAQLSDLPKTGWLKFGHLLLAFLTIMSSWLLMHSVFALHYAHDFYLARSRDQNDGLNFPKTERPTYPDFIHFSYIMGTAAQTADIEITNRHMRMLNTLHALLSFGFNTVILAICINVASGLLGGS